MSKEYIVQVDDDLRNFDELFVGHIRSFPELVRCRDCTHWRRNDGTFKDIDGKELHRCGNDPAVIMYGWEYCSGAEKLE